MYTYPQQGWTERNVCEKVKPYWLLQTSQRQEERWRGWGWRWSLLSHFLPPCIPGGPETLDSLWKVSIGSLLCTSSWYLTPLRRVIMDQLKHCKNCETALTGQIKAWLVLSVSVLYQNERIFGKISSFLKIHLFLVLGVGTSSLIRIYI